MPRARVIGLAVCILTFVFACGAVRGALAGGNVQGTPCPTNGVSAGTGTGAVTDGNNLVCVSNVWQYPVYVMQTGAASAQSSCSTYPAGAERWNTTISGLEVCDGTTWQQMPTSAGTCGAPSGLSFTNVTGAALSTSYSSNTATITYTGCTSALSVSVTGPASAQISINGGAWGTSGSIQSGQTLQARLTSSGSVSTALTDTVTVGSSSTNWSVTTRSATLNAFQTTNGYIGWQIGGLSGADTICQTEAGTNGYAGIYKAIMSDATTSASSRLTLTYPIVNNYDGTTVSAANLWSGSLTNFPKNAAGGSGGNTWTGTNQNGTIVTGQTCTSWSASGATGEYGRIFYGGSSHWAAHTTDACTVAYPLYCIQQ